MQINESIFRFFYGLAHNSVPLDLLIVFFAQYLIYLLVLIAFFTIILEKDFKSRYYFLSLSLLSLILSSGIVAPIIHYFYNSPRPFVLLSGITALVSHPASPSFPSGHTILIIPIALSMFYLNKKLGLWFLGSAILIGLARIMGGVHWPLDILGGILLGSLSFYFVRWILSLRGAKLTNN